MIGLRKLAEAHRDQFYKVIEEAGTDIVVRQPPVPPTSGNEVTKALGSRSQAIGVGDSIFVKGVISGPFIGNTINQNNPPMKVDALGTVQACEVIVRLKVEDCLLDADKKFGKTIFDTAKDVLIDDRPFKIVATERGGLAPIGPYILWVGLEHMGS